MMDERAPRGLEREARLLLGTALLLCFAGGSCALIDLAGLSCSTHPSRRNEVVSTEEELWVRFSRPVQRQSAEGCLRVTSSLGEVEGDLFWSDRRMLRFRPRQPFSPGIRHVLSFAGEVRTANGPAHRLERIVPFYPGSPGPPLQLLSSRPEDGGEISRSEPLVLRFSSAPGREDFRRTFTLSPYRKTELRWTGDGCEVSIHPCGGWDDCTLYRWEVAAGCSGAAASLAEEKRGCFLVQEYGEAPRLITFRRYRRQNGVWTAVAEQPLLLAADEALGLEFSTAVTHSSLRRALSISPPLPGSLYQAEEGLYLYLPAETPAPEQQYRLYISRELENPGGISPGSATVRRFSSAVPALRVEQIAHTPAVDCPPWTGEELLSGQPLTVTVNPGSDHSHGFILRFSRPFPSAAEKYRAEEAIGCRAFFPPHLADPVPVCRSWLGDRELTLVYRGLSPGEGEYRRYYSLEIAAGPSGVRNGAGSYLLEGLRILFSPRIPPAEDEGETAP